MAGPILTAKNGATSLEALVDSRRQTSEPSLSG
jgi:hypothetical protein